MYRVFAHAIITKS